MKKLAAFIVGKRKLIFLLTLLLVGFSFVTSRWVKVEQELESYLPADSDTRVGLDLMRKEFVTFGTADIMVENITYPDALLLQEKIASCEGVDSVAFDSSDTHYSNASALFSVTFRYPDEDERCLQTLAEVKKLLSPFDIYVSTSLGNQEAEIIEEEVAVIIVLVGAIVFLVLLLTTRTYAEVAVLLLTFLAAMLLNKGTNFLLGKISFVSNSVTSILQLALSLDYAVILCNRFKEERETLDTEEATVSALAKAIPEIGASCLTTLGGLVAMLFMRFRIGSDLALCLIKSIGFALLSVFLFMPGLLILFGKLMDRTRHRSFLPRMDFIGTFAFRSRRIVPLIFAVLIAVGCLFSGKCPYVYGYGSIRTPKINFVQLAEQKISENFTSSQRVAVVLPEVDYEKEKELIARLEACEEVNHCTGLSNTEALGDYMLTDRLSPRQFAELTDIDYELSRLIYGLYAAQNIDRQDVFGTIRNNGIPLLELVPFIAEIADSGVVELDAELSDRVKDAAEKIENGKKQLAGENRSRILMYLNLKSGYNSTYEFLEKAEKEAESIYGDKVYLVGDLTTEYDFQKAFAVDNIVVSLISICAVLLVLLFTFHSVGMPVLLILIIQGSIWINFGIPFLTGKPLFFMSYLIVSAIQMGANIDYAIVIASRFQEIKNTMPPEEAIRDTMNFAFPTVATSGTILAMAGFLIGRMTSEATIVGIGQCIARGTVISMILVLFVLPQLLLLGSKIIDKTSFARKKLQLPHGTPVLFLLVFLSLSLTAFPAAAAEDPLTPAVEAEAWMNPVEGPEAITSGEKPKRYLSVNNAEELIDLGRKCSLDTFSEGLTVTLENDILLEDRDFEGIPSFSGTFYGNGHRITGFHLEEEGAGSGFFGEISETGRVCDLTVSGDCLFSGKASGIGGICGINRGILENCTFDGSVQGQEMVGGIAGINESTGGIFSCTSDGSVTGFSMTGGIAGKNTGTIENCTNLAYVNIEKNDPSVNLSELSFTRAEDILSLTAPETLHVTKDTGGIAGYSAGTIRSSVNTSYIGYQHTGYNVGGIAGRTSGWIEGCHNNGSIYGRKDTGGIAGQLEPFVQKEEGSDLTAGPEEALNTLRHLGDRTGEDLSSVSDTILSRVSSMNASLLEAEELTEELSGLLTDGLSENIDEVNEIGDRAEALVGNAHTVSEEVEAAAGGIGESLSELQKAQEEAASIPGDISADLPGSFRKTAEHLKNTAASVRNALEKITASRRDLRNAIGDTESFLNAEEKNGIPPFSDHTDEIDRKTGELSDALERFLEEADLLTGELSDAERLLQEDISVLENQTDTAKEVLRDAIEEAGDRAQGDFLEDISEKEDGETASGKIENCLNNGHVSGDRNTGGIVGSMAPEESADPEEDAEISQSFLKERYQLRAVITGCRNTAEIVARKDCVGAICGRQSLGTIRSSEGYGTAESTDGSYAGGISGLGEGVIRDCYAKCFLKAAKYVGGISGAGRKENSVTVSSRVENCVSLVSADEQCRFCGAVCGEEGGTFTGNCFVSDTLSGIGKKSYLGKAEPISYAELLAREDLPPEFRKFHLVFEADGRVLKNIPFEYGASFGSEVYPLIPKKEGMAGSWDRTDLSSLHFDTVVHANYDRYLTAVGSDLLRNDGRRILFAEGSFEKEDILTVTQEDSGTETAERWSIRIPYDGNTEHWMRFLPASGENNDVRLYLADESGKTPVSYEKTGSYLRFLAEGSEIILEAESNPRVENRAVFYLAVAGVLIVIFGFVFLNHCFRKKTKEKGSGKPEKQPRRQKTGRILRFLLCFVISFSVIAAAWIFAFRPQLFRAGVDALSVIREYARREVFDTDIEAQLSVGGEEDTILLHASKMKSDGKDVFGITYRGCTMYFADGILCFENGRGAAAPAVNTGRWSVAAKLTDIIKNGDISAVTNDGNTVYTVVSRENDSPAGILLKDLLGISSESEEMKLELTVSEKRLKTIRMEYAGMETGSDRKIRLTAKADIRETSSREKRLPEAAAEAIRTGVVQSPGCSAEELLSLIRAMVRMTSANETEAQMEVSAGCGPVGLSRKETVTVCPFRNAESGEGTGTCERIFLETTQKIYTLLSENEVKCEKDGSAFRYVLETKEQDGEDFLLICLPRAEGMQTELTGGQVRLILENGQITSFTVEERGTVVVVDDRAPVNLKIAGSGIGTEYL